MVISCDDQIRSFETIHNAANFTNAVKKISGGGGTSFIPPFEE